MRDSTEYIRSDMNQAAIDAAIEWVAADADWHKFGGQIQHERFIKAEDLLHSFSNAIS